MRNFLVISLTLLLLVPSSGYWITYVSYLANKTYYAEVLCEKKDVEESTCDGFCALKKNLSKQTPEEAPVQENNHPTNLLMEFLPGNTFQEVVSSPFETHLPVYGYSPLRSIFNPEENWNPPKVNA